MRKRSDKLAMWLTVASGFGAIFSLYFLVGMAVFILF
jgi:hypothetical protein